VVKPLLNPHLKGGPIKNVFKEVSLTQIAIKNVFWKGIPFQTQQLKMCFKELKK